MNIVEVKLKIELFDKSKTHSRYLMGRGKTIKEAVDYLFEKSKLSEDTSKELRILLVGKNTSK